MSISKVISPYLLTRPCPISNRLLYIFLNCIETTSFIRTHLPHCNQYQLLSFSGEKPHQCGKCLKRFALGCNMKAHMKTHEEEEEEAAEAQKSHVDVA